VFFVFVVDLVGSRFVSRSFIGHQSAMTSSTESIESKVNHDVLDANNLSFESNEISSDEQLSQLIDSINIDSSRDQIETDGSQSKTTATVEPNATRRTTAQTTIGAKLVEKLEELCRTMWMRSSRIR
jgi:hypothetical protein